MKRFTAAGRNAICAKNWYAGLSLALTLPDICASLEEPDAPVGKRYIAWCDKWLTSQFGGQLSGSDIYQLRCSLVHSGSGEIKKGKIKDYEDFEFFDDTTISHLNFIGSAEINGVEQGNFIQLSTERFSNSVFHAVEEWDKSVAKDPAVKQQKAKLLSIRSAGYVRGPIEFRSEKAPVQYDITSIRIAGPDTFIFEMGPAESPISQSLDASQMVMLASKMLTVVAKASAEAAAAKSQEAIINMATHHVPTTSISLTPHPDNPALGRLSLGFGAQAISAVLDAETMFALAREAAIAAEEMGKLT